MEEKNQNRNAGQDSQTPHKRRVRYKGTHPRRFEEKYKELNPEKYADTIEHVIQKGGTPAGMHISIMVKEILDFLQIKPGQKGLDATLGYGGHTRAMLEQLHGEGHIYGLDVDPIESVKTKKRLEDLGFGEEIMTVRQMNFADIDQDEARHDVTYENTQARVRTLVLMNLANRLGGLVIGTGDLSELALGWATYNGDHMSMYGVNASVPKTLIRHIVASVADETESSALRQVLRDILDTPVSPELLPAENGKISQQTEEIVGPYTLHDFFLYYAVRWGFSPAKVYYLARQAFAGEYTNAVLLKWLRNFYRRFFSQQFKRSCLPDGPKVGSVTLSPRGDWRMPSDASAALWVAQADALEE